jgi:hypothetical protein
MTPSPTRLVRDLRAANQLRTAAARAADQGEGEWHVGVIQQHVATYANCRYLEVGVRHATCWNRVAPLAGHAEGVDIDPDVLNHVRGDAKVHIMPSDDYFAGVGAGRTWDVIFLDGDHSYEQVAKDFDNALPHLQANGTIVLHDRRVRLRDRLPARGATRAGPRLQRADAAPLSGRDAHPARPPGPLRRRVAQEGPGAPARVTFGRPMRSKIAAKRWSYVCSARTLR